MRPRRTPPACRRRYSGATESAAYGAGDLVHFADPQRVGTEEERCSAQSASSQCPPAQEIPKSTAEASATLHSSASIARDSRRPRCERMRKYRMRKLLVATQAVENASPR